MSSTGIDPRCGYCGRPIVPGSPAFYGGGATPYHAACTQPPKTVLSGVYAPPVGCICPPTSEQTCQRVGCPRKASKEPAEQ